MAMLLSVVSRQTVLESGVIDKMKRSVGCWTFSVLILAALLVLWGCAPVSSPQPYSLVARVAPLSDQGRIVAAVIDVNGLSCSVRVVTLDSTKPWTPVCLVTKDQTDFKSFSIGGHSVDLAAIGDTFKVLSSNLSTLPAAETTASGNATATSAALPFPNVWSMTPYPGQMKLKGQNTSFMVTSAMLSINGSRGMLEVNYKNTYAPLRLQCTVTTNKKGDFTLLFNPPELTKLIASGYVINDNSIDLVFEGQNIAGNIWDSRGFASWSPSLPPQWIAVSN